MERKGFDDGVRPRGRCPEARARGSSAGLRAFGVEVCGTGTGRAHRAAEISFHAKESGRRHT